MARAYGNDDSKLAGGDGTKFAQARPRPAQKTGEGPVGIPNGADCLSDRPFFVGLGMVLASLATTYRSGDLRRVETDLLTKNIVRLTAGC